MCQKNLSSSQEVLQNLVEEQASIQLTQGLMSASDTELGLGTRCQMVSRLFETIATNQFESVGSTWMMVEHTYKDVEKLEASVCTFLTRPKSTRFRNSRCYRAFFVSSYEYDYAPECMAPQVLPRYSMLSHFTCRMNRFPRPSVAQL